MKVFDIKLLPLYKFKCIDQFHCDGGNLGYRNGIVPSRLKAIFGVEFDILKWFETLL